MNRPIKFRAWNPQGDMLAPWELGDGTTNEKLIREENWTIMQFTGLLDKNGKEIYEGDVVVNKNEPCKECEDTKRSVGVVSFHDMGFWAIGNGFHLSYNISNTGKGNVPNQFDYLEVIGNIYSNPELLSN